jgi:topoisomerase-4 subunit A
MVAFTINYIEAVKEKYGPEFPRRSELRAFDEIDARAAAAANLCVGFHRETGFVGHKLKAEHQAMDMELNCSEYDRLLLIFKDGLYKVVPVPDKLFVGPELYWMGVVKNDQVFNLIYRHGPENLAYVKRFATPKFILNREYRLFEEHKRSMILMLLLGKAGIRARISLAPSSRAKYNAVEVEFDECLIKGVAAKGKRVANRAVRRVTDITGTAKKEPVSPQGLPGFMGEEKDE